VNFFSYDKNRNTGSITARFGRVESRTLVNNSAISRGEGGERGESVRGKSTDFRAERRRRVRSLGANIALELNIAE